MKERTIWKWSLALTDVQALQIPRGAKLLSVQMQGELPQLWALVDPSEPRDMRTIRIIGTGHPIDEHPGEYVGTFQMRDGALVFHVFSP